MNWTTIKSKMWNLQWDFFHSTLWDMFGFYTCVVLGLLGFCFVMALVVPERDRLATDLYNDTIQNVLACPYIWGMANRQDYEDGRRIESLWSGFADAAVRHCENDPNPKACWAADLKESKELMCQPPIRSR